MRTYTGGQFWPFDPDPEDVRIEDIAHALSLQCRFAGHVPEFYSVAQHCLLVEQLTVPPSRETCLAALLHDAAEAYVLDMPRPLKRDLPDYRRVERAVTAAVALRFGLPLDFDRSEKIKSTDNIVLVYEAKSLLDVDVVRDWKWESRWASAVHTAPHISLLGSKPAELRYLDVFGGLAK